MIDVDRLVDEAKTLSSPICAYGSIDEVHAACIFFGKSRDHDKVCSVRFSTEVTPVGGAKNPRSTKRVVENFSVRALSSPDNI